MWAVANRRDEVARVLIETGADIHARSNVVPREYQTGSRYVAYDDVRFVVKVEEGGFTPLLFAARSGDAASAALLLAAGAQVNDPAPSGVDPAGRRRAQRPWSGRRALPRTRRRSPTRPARATPRCTRRCCEAICTLVKTLLARGAKVDAPLERGTPVRRYSQDYAFSADLIGATPFWLAARYGDVPIMRALADAGADTRVVMKDGSNALVVAVAASSGFGSGDRRERYLTPVEIAAKVESDDERITLEAAKLALALGSEINHTNRNGDSAAASRRRPGSHHRRAVPGRQRRGARREEQARADAARRGAAASARRRRHRADRRTARVGRQPAAKAGRPRIARSSDESIPSPFGSRSR